MFRLLMVVKLGVFAFVMLSSSAFAQITDPRVFQLEEQVRQLTGRVEELNFQLLQQQEEMRKSREDLEFRLQELEDKQGALTNDDAPATNVAEATSSAAEKPAVEDVASATAPIGKAPRLQADNAPELGAPPRNLGVMTLDPDGNVVDTSVDFSAQSVEQSIDGTQVASLGGAQNPEELYQAGYAYVLDGDYALAEDVFSTFVDTYQDDALIADARFWLGESLLAQGKFEEAVDMFIEVRSLHPNASKAPETMLKIGSIMAALGNREVACVTFDDALKTQTNMSEMLRKRIGQERVNAKC